MTPILKLHTSMAIFLQFMHASTHILYICVANLLLSYTCTIRRCTIKAVPINSPSVVLKLIFMYPKL